MVSLRPNYFIFIGFLKKGDGFSSKPPKLLLIRHCYDSQMYASVWSVLQERLNKQQEDNDVERQRLQDLIARLESQIREQTRMLEDVSIFIIWGLVIFL